MLSGLGPAVFAEQPAGQPAAVVHFQVVAGRQRRAFAAGRGGDDPDQVWLAVAIAVKILQPQQPALSAKLKPGSNPAHFTPVFFYDKEQLAGQDRSRVNFVLAHAWLRQAGQK
ncbi:MAG TPA: hypothetical protein VHA30_01165 [Patescibacteria group bacterium]|nr:hypothetical protein [Patescibacteria group bacterium]